jgi:hypothetical protein
MRYAKSTLTVSLVAGATVMTWPAIYNGFPLIFPDSMSYLEDGARVARAVFLRELSHYYGGRSFIYGLGILPFHWKINPWPIVGLHAALTAYVLWLVVRSFELSLPKYLALVIVLSATTGLGWFVSYVMPDILGPLLYLVIYLIMFSWQSLSRAERVFVLTLGAWAVASHSTHIVLGIGVGGLGAILMMFQRKNTAQVIRATARTAAIIALGAAANVAIHAYLYGKPSLTGPRAPFLLARLIADGPGRWYLQNHCAELRLAICEHVNDLPHDVATFLWAPKAIWRNASLPKQERLRDEEAIIVVGVLKTYPKEELEISLRHFWHQLLTFGLWNYYPDPYILEVFDDVLPPHAKLQYLRSRQAMTALHENVFTLIQAWTVVLSIFMVIGLGSIMFMDARYRDRKLIGLAAIIIFSVITNAAVTGILSNVEDRYQSRVIWLLPLLAALMLLVYVKHEDSAKPP